MNRSPDIALYPAERMKYHSERGWDFLAYWAIRPLIDLTRVKFESEGLDRLYAVADSGAPTFVFSNHISWADHFLILYFVINGKPYRSSPIAKEKYYKWPGARDVLRFGNVIPITNIKITFARWFHRKEGRVPTEADFVRFMETDGKDPQHPVNRQKSEAMTYTVDNVRDMLGRGRVILGYPEGTRSKDGRLQATKTGIMQLPLMFRGTIVPTAVTGTNRILNRDNHWYDFIKYFFWKGPTISCRFGEPLTWEEALARVEDKFQRRSDPVNLTRVRALRDEIEAGTFCAFSPDAARYERIFDEIALLTMRRINDILPEEYRATESVEVKYSRSI